MPIYKNIDHDSNVSSYEEGEGFIIVQFKDGMNYEYTNVSAGADKIDQMKIYARLGNGLNSYIGRIVKKGFARKYR